MKPRISIDDLIQMIAVIIAGIVIIINVILIGLRQDNKYPYQVHDTETIVTATRDIPNK